MRAAGTYRVRTSSRPMARGLGDFITEGLANDCIQVGQKFCEFFAGKGMYAASLAYLAGSSSPPMPPVVGAPASNAPPSSAAEAQSTISNLTADQITAWQAENQNFFNQMAAATPSGDGGSPSGLSPTAIAGIAVGGIALVLLITSGRRSRR